MSIIQLEDKEVFQLLLEVMDICGYDFTGYSPASIKRRVNRFLIVERISGISELADRLRSSDDYLNRFLQELTVNVTEMFRDPSFFRHFREQILPTMSRLPLIKIWHAGCSTGEEVYSMAVLLAEAGLLERSLIYATDISPKVLQIAAEGVLPISQMKKYSSNYISSGGIADFSHYYIANYNTVNIRKELRERVVFANHNLVCDSSFNEFNIIICRNVLIYFDRFLQDRVLRLFDESLSIGGVIGLGGKETLKFSSVASGYKQVGQKEKVWIKTRD